MVLLEPFFDSKKPLLVDLWFYLSLFGEQKTFTCGLVVLLEPFWIAKNLYLWICGFSRAFLGSKKPSHVDLWFFKGLFG